MRTDSADSLLRVVVRPALAAGGGSANPPALLVSLGEPTPLASPRGGFALAVPVAKVAVSQADTAVLARITCQQLQLQLGSPWWVAPVLVGDDGGERYPTGLLSVRFLGAVDDQALARLAQAAELHLVQRTRFTDQQALFRPNDACTYLPDLVARVAAQPGVAAVWPDAESNYRRGA